MSWLGVDKKILIVFYTISSWMLLTMLIWRRQPLTTMAMTLIWSYYAFTAATIITMPLYVLILYVVARRPRLTLFHVFMLSQGVADTLALLCFNLLVILRVSQLCDGFYWDRRNFLPSFTFLSNYYLLYLRCFGITLISLQRYITVCQYGSTLEKITTKASPIIFVILQWCIALVITAPILTSAATYNTDVDVIIPNNILARANLISVITVVLWFIICAMCYIAVLSHLFRSKLSVSRKNRHEFRLSIQVAGLMIAFLLVFVYHIGQYIMLESDTTGALDVWRQFHPLMNGVLSCVQPWTCLFFNTDMQVELKKILCCKTKFVNKGSVLPSPVAVLSRTIA